MPEENAAKTARPVENPFLGTWLFDPSRAEYEFGDPPRSGRYVIEREGNGLKFTMDWITAGGQSIQMSFNAIPDGEEHPYENPAVADTLSLTRLDAHTLDSTAKKGGQTILYARRTLSDDGRTMTVIQSGPAPDGQTYRNVSVYRRV